MMENRLANTALSNPASIPLVYLLSNLKIVAIPKIIKMPANISSFEILFLFISGSNIAVNKVMDERQTKVTGTVDNFMEAKNNIQCPPTKAPVNISLKKLGQSSFNAVLLNLKYRNKDTDAMSTRYQTRLTADTEISAPSMPVNPQMKTVK